MTESNFEIEIKKRAHRRFKGALVLALVSLVLLAFLIRPAPITPNQGLIINIIRPNVPDAAFNIPALPSLAAPTTATKGTSSKATGQDKVPATIIPDDAENKTTSAPPAQAPKPSAYFLHSPMFTDTKALAKLTQALERDKISFQKKVNITEVGQAELTLIFGPYPDKKTMQSAQKSLAAKFSDLKKLTVMEE